MSHTPGPWEYRYCYKSNRGEACYEVRQVDGEMKAITGWGSVTQTHDDARLIAAAPELLAACKSGLELLLATLHDLERDPDDYGVVAMMQDALARARAAGSGEADGVSDV